MHPVLIRIGPLTIHTYGVLVAAGFLIGLALAVRQARKEGIPGERIADIGFYILLSALIGSRLFFVLQNAGHYVNHPLDILKVWEGGLVFYGGLLLAIPVAVWCVKKYRLDGWQTADIFAPSIALGHGIGRIGCLFAGCCHGKPSDLPWAITFRDPECLAVLNTPLHPTQLYEAGGEFLNFLILLILRRHQSFKGQLFLSYVILYSVLRFSVEFFRGDEARGYIFSGLSVGQGISIVAALAAVVVMVKKSGRKALSR